MKLTLQDAELRSAVEAYVFKLGFNPEAVQVVEVDFTAGRGANGYSAEVDIQPITAKPVVKEEPVPTTPSAPIPVKEEEVIEAEPEEVVEEEDPLPPAGNLFGPKK